MKWVNVNEQLPYINKEDASINDVKFISCLVKLSDNNILVKTIHKSLIVLVWIICSLLNVVVVKHSKKPSMFCIAPIDEPALVSTRIFSAYRYCLLSSKE